MSVTSENETVGSDTWLGYRGLTSYHTLAKASQLSMWFLFASNIPDLTWSFFYYLPFHYSLSFITVSFQKNVRGRIQSAKLTQGSFFSYQALVTLQGAVAKLFLHLKARAHDKGITYHLKLESEAFILHNTWQQLFISFQSLTLNFHLTLLFMLLHKYAP